MKIAIRSFVGVYLIAVILLSGCSPGEPIVEANGSIQAEEQEGELDSQKEYQEFEVDVNEKPDDPDLADITVIDRVSEEIVYTITLEDVDTSNIHPAEYWGGNLYIRKRIGLEENYRSELWRYDQDGQGEVLYSFDSFQFRVAPNESLIAINNFVPGEGMQEKIIILDQKGKEVSSIVPKDELQEESDNMLMNLGGWSDDSSVFWGNYAYAYRPALFFVYEHNTQEIIVLDASDFTLQSEFSFNPNTRQLLFSDAPTFMEMSGYLRFLIQQTPVTLYLHDFSTGVQTPLDITISDYFNPKWISVNQISYDDPMGKGRIHYNLTEGSSLLIWDEPEEEIVVYPREIPLEFEDVMEELVAADTDVMLPPYFPIQAGSPSVYPDVTQSYRGSYWIKLHVGENCQPNQGCYYGTLGVREYGVNGGAEASLMPFWGPSQYTYVPLTRRIPGYYVAATCATCSNPALYWTYNRTEYKLSVVGANQDALVVIVNLMLENSLPDEDEYEWRY